MSETFLKQYTAPGFVVEVAGDLWLQLGRNQKERNKLEHDCSFPLLSSGCCCLTKSRNWLCVLFPCSFYLPFPLIHLQSPKKFLYLVMSL